MKKDGLAPRPVWGKGRTGWLISCARRTRTPEWEGSAWSVLVLAEGGTPDPSYFQIGGAPLGHGASRRAEGGRVTAAGEHGRAM